MRITRCKHIRHSGAILFSLLFLLISAVTLTASDFVADKDKACLYEGNLESVQPADHEFPEGLKNRAPYQGVLKIYVCEKVSRYNDYQGDPYEHGFLEFAYDTSLNLEYQQTFNRTLTWDPANHGWSGVTSDNIEVIAVLFNHMEGHHAYSDPPSGGHFLAYYADATAKAEPGGTGHNQASGSYTHTVFVEEATSGT